MPFMPFQWVVTTEFWEIRGNDFMVNPMMFNEIGGADLFCVTIWDGLWPGILDPSISIYILYIYTIYIYILYNIYIYI